MTDLEIFHNAPDDATPEALAAYLDEACGDDEELRVRVESLFAVEDRTDDFLEKSPHFDSGQLITDTDAPTVASNGAISVGPASERIGEGEGDEIGNYRLFDIIGEGGFGTVWRAEQLEPVKREIAFKIIKPGRDTEEVIRRFELERQALAVMDHPNIAKVYDAGATPSGRPWFAMELVDGKSVIAYCDQKRLSIKERLELFIPVCRAVQHAHAKGIVHRDLKPSNVLIAEHDGHPVPKVIDFGIAKAIEESLGENSVKTIEGMVIGTPIYMSPEQLSGLSDVDTRSDVYSLGVLLYELLAGVTPIDPKELRKAGYAEMERLICEVEPPVPSVRVNTTTSETASFRRSDTSRLVKAIRGDLDWIVMRALEKNRAHRYDTPALLALDIEHYLADEPVTAAAPSFAYQLRKMARRHRGTIGSAAVIVGLIIVGGIVSTLLAIKATRAEREAEQNEKVATIAKGEAEQNERVISYWLAEESPLQDNPGLGLARLAKIVRDDPTNRSAGERLMLALQQRDFENSKVESFPGNYVRFSPDGKILLAGHFQEQREIKFRDAATGELLGKPIETFGILWHAEFSPDGRQVLIASGSGSADPSAVEVWDWETGEPVIKPLKHHLLVQYAAFSPDGNRILSMDDNGTVKISDIRPENINASGGLIEEPVEFYSRGPAIGGQWSPDGTRIGIAAQSQAGSAGEIWDTEGNLLVAVHHNLEYEKENRGGGEIWSVRFNHDGSRFITTGTDRTARLWETETGDPVGIPMQHRDQVEYAEFSPDGRLVVTASRDGTARVWYASDGRPVTAPLSYSGRVLSAHFGPLGMRVIAGSDQGDVQVWDALTGNPIGPRIREREPVVTARFHPDPEHARFVVGSFNSRSKLRRLRPRQPDSLILRHGDGTSWREVGRNVNSADFSPDGRRIVSAGSENWIRIWDAKQGIQVEQVPMLGAGQTVRFSPDGERFLSTSSYVGVTFWDAPSDGSAIAHSAHQPPPKKNVFRAEFSPDPNSNWVAGAGAIPPQAWLWNTPKDGEVEEKALFQGTEEAIPITTWVGFNRQGTRLATISEDRRLRIWGVPGGDLQITLEVPPAIETGELAVINHASFSPDDTRLATADGDNCSRIWDISESADPANREIRALPHADQVWWTEFSPDGRWVATASMDGTARVWDAATGEPVGLEMRHEGPVRIIRFSRDGRRVVTSSDDRTARVWDAASGFPLSDPLRHDGKVLSVAFASDDRQVLTTGADTTVRLWTIPPAPEGPVPEWVSRWAEAVVQIRIEEDQSLEKLDWGSWNAMREEILGLPDDGYYTRIALWFYDDFDTRPISPFSEMTLEEYVESCLSQELVASFEEAVRVAPSHGIALGRLALLLREQNVRNDPVKDLRADYYEERAILLGEKQLEAEPDNLALRALLIELRGQEDDIEEALQAFRRQLEGNRNAETAEWDGLIQIIEAFERVDETDREIEARLELVELASELKEEDDAEAWRWREELAGRLEELGRLRESLEQWQQLIAMASQQDEAIGMRARFHQRAAEVHRGLGEADLAAENHARAIEMQKQWAESLRDDPKRDKPLLALRKLARWAVEFENWETAEATYREMIEITRADRYAADECLSMMMMAALYLEMGGREDDYRELCRTMLDRFSDAEDPQIRDRTARVCCALPPEFFAKDGAMTIEEAEGMVKEASAITRAFEDGAMMSLAYGMAAYRDSRYAEASGPLEYAERLGRRYSVEVPVALYCLACSLAYQSMSAHQVGDSEEAAKFLEKAQETESQLTEKSLWYQHAFIRRAIEEAEGLISN